MKRLSKKQALEILPAVVDGEVSDEQQAAFFDFIESDHEVRMEYEDALLIKKLLSDKLPKFKAPEHLKYRVMNLIDELDRESALRDMKTGSDSIRQAGSNTGGGSFNRQNFLPAFRYMAAAAVIFLITLATLNVLDQLNSSGESYIDTVENYTAIHFTNSSGKLASHDFSSSSESDAEKYLEDHFGISITVPKINGATFTGLVMADFYNGMITPLLEYRQDGIDEAIFLFAFEMDEISRNTDLGRVEEAVKSCIAPTDFHVAEIDAKHVLSWKWENKWYTAVSNHNGYDLAALIEPLNYSSP